MPSLTDEGRQIDALSFWNTGAGSDGGAQSDPAASTGNFRSNTRARFWGTYVKLNGIAGLRVDRTLGVDETGALGTIYATSNGDGVIWDPSGGTPGDAVAISNGETKVVKGGTIDHALVVTRKTSGPMNGAGQVRIVETFNGIVGFDDVTVSGSTQNFYRGMMARADGDYGVLAATFHIGTLGTQAITDSGVLALTGTGTIGTTGSFADWPEQGWAHIRTSGGEASEVVTREIVYYTERTDTELTISNTAHRGLLGTSAAAGLADDTVDAVPGIRIAGEAAAADGSIQSIADVTTAPTGVSWVTGLTAETGVTATTPLGPGKNFGLWIHREIPANITATPLQENSIIATYEGA